jgi:hypothetical protein
LKVGTRAFTRILKKSARRASASVDACGDHYYA